MWQELVRAWHAEERFAQVQVALPTGPRPARAATDLLLGSGRLSSRSARDPQRRRLTVQGLLSLEAAGHCLFHEFSVGDVRYWVFEKYTPAGFPAKSRPPFWRS